jgi:hypothetical protein
MLRQMGLISLSASVFIATASFAQAPATAPAGTTGLCNDGSYSSAATKKGACSSHQGVKEWYGTAPSAATVPVAAPATAATPAPANTMTRSAPAAAAASGGGPGMVWVNTNSKVYHCPSDKWYGKTKSGAYMSEADAIAKGNKADHGKACSN